MRSVLQNVGPVGESGGDLLGVLEVQTFVVPHAIVRRVILAESDAEEDVVRFVILGAQKVRVVGGDDGEIHFFREAEDSRVQLGLILGVVGLDLEVVIGKGVGVP